MAFKETIVIRGALAALLLSTIFVLYRPVAPPFSSPSILAEISSDSPGDKEGEGFSIGMQVKTPIFQYDFYKEHCPPVEKIVRATTAQIFQQNRNITAQLLRLMFHDCFIEGCDASILLDNSNGNENQSSEKDATPNRSLNGFDFIDTIKAELEDACPGVVSCADTLVLATRDAIVLAGGPHYPVLTGRTDSKMSYYARAMADIPKPDANISEILRLFSLRGFTPRDVVALLGAHNIGKIGCEFIEPRLHNFKGTGEPDASIPPDFLAEMRKICGDNTSNSSSNSPTSSAAPPMTVTPRAMTETVTSRSQKGIPYYQQLSSSVSSGSAFGPHYYDSLLRGRGLLYSDQQLMANNETVELVRFYATDDGTAFRIDFARAMVKMSNLGNFTSSTQEQVRFKCSQPWVGDSK
ncbi:Peroxidase [Bertholletia excelsa]